jgi:hypothetical protein
MILEKAMPSKTPAIISAVSTVLVFIVFGVLSIFMQMLGLNDAGESQWATAMGISLLCQGTGALLAVGFAWWSTNLTIRRFKWSAVLAVFTAVAASVLLGAVISYLSMIISILLAGIG